MATWTGIEVANAALEHLGIKAAGQDASAEDYAQAASVYVSVYNQLRRLGLATWDDDAVEEEVQQPLARHLAGELAVKFGFTGMRLAEIKQDAASGFAQLREQGSGIKQRAAIRANYF